MNDFRIPLGDLADNALDFVIDNIGWLFAALREFFLAIYTGVDVLLTAPPFWVMIIIACALAFLARGWVFAVGTALTFLLVAGVGQWENAMDTLALVLVGSTVALLLSIPLGIAAARSNVVSSIVRPVLDFMQTTPAFVYLIPALLLFRVGVVPGIVATVIFSLAPGVRLTELGIRGVDKEVVEAGEAFGASQWRILRQIQLPLALPTIMAGVNQVIMLSLSMVVIAGLAGARGLGGEIIASLNRLDVGLGVEAGVSVVILAIYLDRLTASFGKKSGLLVSITARVREVRTARVDPTAEPVATRA